MCTSCAKKLARVAGRKRRSKIGKPMAKSSITSKSTLTNAAGVIGGVVAANFINKMEFVQANDILKILVPVAGAVATGMLVQGGIEGVRKFAPDVASKVGLAGPTPFRSYLTPGVAGAYETTPSVVL